MPSSINITHSTGGFRAWPPDHSIRWLGSLDCVLHHNRPGETVHFCGRRQNECVRCSNVGMGHTMYPELTLPNTASPCLKPSIYQVQFPPVVGERNDRVFVRRLLTSRPQFACYHGLWIYWHRKTSDRTGYCCGYYTCKTPVSFPGPGGTLSSP